MKPYMEVGDFVGIKIKVFCFYKTLLGVNLTGKIRKEEERTETAFQERQKGLDHREKLLVAKESAVEKMQSEHLKEMLPSLITLMQNPMLKAATRQTVPGCSVCLEEDVLSEYTFECGHPCMCQKCSPNIKECPMCRCEGLLLRIYI